MSIWKRFGAGTLGIVLLASSAAADTEGFFFGLDLHSSHIGAADPGADSLPGSIFVDEQGGGGSLFVGWGIGPSFPVRLALTGAVHETTDPEVEVRYGSVTVEGMYLFRDPAPLRPYLVGGIGGFSVQTAKSGFDFETTGPGVVFGVMLYFFGETFALDFEVRGEFVNWEETRATRPGVSGGDVTVTTPIEEEGAAAKLLLGGSWWF